MNEDSRTQRVEESTVAVNLLTLSTTELELDSNEFIYIHPELSP